VAAMYSSPPHTHPQDLMTPSDGLVLPLLLSFVVVVVVAVEQVVSRTLLTTLLFLLFTPSLHLHVCLMYMFALALDLSRHPLHPSVSSWLRHDPQYYPPSQCPRRLV